MEPWMIGAAAGAAIGWILLAIFGPKGHFEAPNIWVIDEEGIGCLTQIVILLVCAGLGAVAGEILLA